MLLQHPVDCPGYDRHLLGIDTLLAVLGGESRRKQQNIPLAERDVQSIGNNGKKIAALVSAWSATRVCSESRSRVRMEARTIAKKLNHESR